MDRRLSANEIDKANDHWFINAASSGFGTGITATNSPELKRLLGPAAYNSVKRPRGQRHKVCTDAVDFSDCLFGQGSIFAFNE
jgi:diacylglycerol kinase family enzyme